VTDLDRSWLRRGLVSPPHFGRTLHDVWTDATLVFKRDTVVRDPLTGEFQSQGVQTYRTTRGHVRRVTNVAGPMVSTTEALVRNRRLDIRVPYPEGASTTDYPQIGDVVEHTLDNGSTQRMRVIDVASPRGWQDHLHVVAEESG